MKKLLLGLSLALVLGRAARADVPPSPPPPLEPPPPALAHPPRLRPMPIAVIGIALSLALGVGGICAARFRGRPWFQVVGWLGAAAALGIAGLAMFNASRAWNDFEVQKAKYEETKTTHAKREAEHKKELANWRPSGPVRPPFGTDQVGLAVSLLAADPDAGFPQCLPWAAIVVNRYERIGRWIRLVFVDLTSRRTETQNK